MKNRSFFSPVGKKFFLGMAIILSSITLSCGDDNDRIKPIPPKEPTHTLFMYMPWSSNLTSFFKINIADMSDAIATGMFKNERVLVFFATSSTKASLFELVYKATDGTCEQKILKEYENHPCTTAEGITEILNEVKQLAPADKYSMTIGGHGMGWLPVNKTKALPFESSTSHSSAPLYHWEAQGDYLTRYFGGTSPNHQTEITTLAQAIENAGIVMEYILFDDCYMSNVEVAYDLRHVTRHFIASTSEVMAYGMPYHLLAEHMLGEVDYEGISQTFYDFYMNYSMPCGTIAMTVTSELDSLATLMREINTRYTWDEDLTSDLQALDGYNPHLFYDYRDYVANLCADSVLLSRFDEQLLRTVPLASCKHTPTYYSALNNRQTSIERFCGLTISEPSTHYLADPKDETNWYKATHVE